MSAIFISHSSADQGWARDIATWLERDQRYTSLFLDFDPEKGIPAGTSWRMVLNRQLKLCRIVIVVCSQRYCASQWCLAELGIAIHRGKHVLPLRIEPHDDHSDLPSLLSETQATVWPQIELLAGVAECWEVLEGRLKGLLSWRERLEWPPRGEPEAAPFPGLLAFQRELAPVFFGRDGAIERVRQQLDALAQRTPALLLLHGPSGSGKSSLVRAGVVPQLLAQHELRWRVVGPFRPGPQPFRSLAMALLEEDASDLTESEAWDEVGADALGQRLDQLVTGTNSPLLLVIDQFEELLLDDVRVVQAGRAGEPLPAAARSPSQAEQFLLFLEALLRRDLSSLVILATLRTDALDSLQPQWGVIKTFAVTIPLEPIQPEDFGVLITGPAERMGLTLQPGLQERLVAESGGRDALPLLAFTLRELWRKRVERGEAVAGPNGAWYDLTMADYEALGGVAGVVSCQAALCWDPRTSDEADTAALREAFLFALVRLNEEGQAAKHPARWEELPERSRPLLKRFVQMRLLVSGGGDLHDQVEIAHEALLRTWEPLREWIKEGRPQMEQRRRVRRYIADLALNQPPQARLAALQGLLTLWEANPADVTPAQESLAALLTYWAERGGDLRELSLEIQLLSKMAGEASLPALSSFLERQQLREPLEMVRAAPLLEALCQVAAVLREVHLRQLPCAKDQALWLLLPSATLNDDGRMVRTDLVRLRLWATPRLDAPGAWFEQLGDGVALTMVAVPAGGFLMGSPLEELDRLDQEGPQHQVNLEGFWIGQTPITQAQWSQVMDTNPSRIQSNLSIHHQLPVEGVSWHDAIEFCAKLSERCGRHYTLPSEAQWEYACRAGTVTPFHCGSSLIAELASFNADVSPGVPPRGDCQGQITPVGQFPANCWGLHDLHGNVWEWCLDQWHSSYVGAPDDGSAWLASEADDEMETDRVLRGGSWSFGSLYCRSAHRNFFPSGKADTDVGFRVICDPRPLPLSFEPLVSH